MPVIAFSEPSDLVMLHIVYRIAAAYTRSQEDSRDSMFSQEVFLLWEQAVSRFAFSFFLREFLQEGTQQQTSFQGTIWLSGYPCWTGGCSSPFWILSSFNQVMPVLGIVVEAMAHIM